MKVFEAKCTLLEDWRDVRGGLIPRRDVLVTHSFDVLGSFHKIAPAYLDQNRVTLMSPVCIWQESRNYSSTSTVYSYHYRGPGTSDRMPLVSAECTCSR